MTLFFAVWFQNVVAVRCMLFIACRLLFVCCRLIDGVVSAVYYALFVVCCRRCFCLFAVVVTVSVTNDSSVYLLLCGVCP